MSHATAGAHDGVTVRVPAKVNLQLSVGPRRADGFHTLATVYQAVSLYDHVTVAPGRPGATGGVRVTGADRALVPADRANLAWQAVERLAAHQGRPADVTVSVHKGIPVAGGMAGGSADAAAALVACDRLWGARTPAAELAAIAADLGSDVPFLCTGGTAVGTGRGELLGTLPVKGVCHWVFAIAEHGLSTPAVYAECDRLRAVRGRDVPRPVASEALVVALRDGDTAALGGSLANDLEAAAVSLRPRLREVLAAGRAAGALGALVSGSGPTCAFLVTDPGSGEVLAKSLADARVCRATRTAYGPVGGPEIVSGPPPG